MRIPTGKIPSLLVVAPLDRGLVLLGAMLAMPFGPNRHGRESRMAGFLFRLETEDGAPAEPPTLDTAVPNWRAGDEILLGRRALRVVRIRDDDADQPPVLVVEDVA
jgi:hypothetical protein